MFRCAKAHAEISVDDSIGKRSTAVSSFQDIKCERRYSFEGAFLLSAVEANGRCVSN
jgi:hypothetical protein